MNTLSQTELSEICSHLREKSPKNISRIYGGHIHSAWKIDFSEYSIFVKKNIRRNKFLQFENHCLNDLMKYINTENLVVPKVLGYIFTDNNELLLLEWIDLKNNNQRQLGQGLAEMHLKSNKNNPKRFGYSKPGFIGKSTQLAGWYSKWSDCFIKLRLEPQLSNFKNNYYDYDIFKELKLKIENQLIKHEPTNSLVHGDLWSGNVGIGNRNQGVIFDPACWWADSEVDIAMSYLFGCFNKEFYEEYHKLIPKKEGFANRLIIYNFYHILNHANMFGGIYCKQVHEYIHEILLM